jgi:hypothetical protein
MRGKVDTSKRTPNPHCIVNFSTRAVHSCMQITGLYCTPANSFPNLQFQFILVAKTTENVYTVAKDAIYFYHEDTNVRTKIMMVRVCAKLQTGAQS